MAAARDKITGLTEKQQAFVAVFLATGNASEAYRQAYTVNKMSAIAIRTEAYRTLNDPFVARMLENTRKASIKAVSDKHKVTLERLTAELMPIATADAGKFFEWDEDSVKLVPSARLSRRLRGVVSEVSQTTTATGGTIRVKLHDKLAAIQQLAKLHGLVTEKFEVAKTFDDMSDDELEAFIAARAAGRPPEE